jgi:hypothetical protein
VAPARGVGSARISSQPPSATTSRPADAARTSLDTSGSAEDGDRDRDRDRARGFKVNLHTQTHAL